MDSRSGEGSGSDGAGVVFVSFESIYNQLTLHRVRK